MKKSVKMKSTLQFKNMRYIIILLLSLCCMTYCWPEINNDKFSCRHGIFMYTCCPKQTTPKCSCESSQEPEIEYSLKTEVVNFETAFVLCKQLGMELASIRSKEEQRKLTNYLLSGSHGITIPTSYIFTCCSTDTTPKCKCQSKSYTYSFGSEAVDFKTAYTYCQQMGMELASISSQQEEEDLTKYIKSISETSSILSEERIWISGVRIKSKNAFFWMSNGNPVVYQNFLAGQPDNNAGKEDCLHLVYRDNQFQWNDVHCTYESVYVCQSKK